MPETRFQIEWPDGSQETCYSPSLVVKQFLDAGSEYDLPDFVERSRAALQEGSRRVQAKFGFPCSLALGQLQRIETKAQEFAAAEHATVKLLNYTH